MNETLTTLENAEEHPPLPPGNRSDPRRWTPFWRRGPTPPPAWGKQSAVMVVVQKPDTIACSPA